jgi:hypothetical protein
VGISNNKNSRGGGRTDTQPIVTLFIALPVAVIIAAVTAVVVVLVVVVVIAALLLAAVEEEEVVVVVVVVVVAGSSWWWMQVWMQCGGGCLVVVVDAGVDAVAVVVAWLPFWVRLGDAASHVSDVGTCCPNLCTWRWPGSSMVKRVLTVTVEVRGSNPRNNKCFVHKIKLNWL